MYSEEFPYYISFFFFVLFITYYLKIFAEKNVSDEIINRNPFAINILSKPISIGILITIYFELAFFPLAPSAITEIFRVLLVVPILLLFPSFISKQARGPLYFISGVYILQQTIELTVGNSIYLRIFIILLTLMMFGGLIWFLKMDTNNIPAKRTKVIHQLQIIARLLLIILLISLVGNIIGNTALSTLIFYGVMRTINISLILITSLQVFYTLVTVLFETKFANISLIIKNRRQEVIKTIFSFTKFIALIFWIIKFLDNFEIYDSIKENVLDFLTMQYQIGNISFTISNILLFFFSIWLATKISKISRFFIENEVFPRVILPRGVPAAISLMLNYTILSLGFLISLSFIGFDIEKLTIVIGALGVGFGFGLQNIVNNFISGLILLFERPIQVGDTISLTNLMGSVKRIGIRASIVQTFDGAEVIVPNADLISGQVINWTLSDSMRRIEIKIGVHFDSDPGKVMELLNSAIEDEDEILKNPAPYILYHGMKKSTQDFVLRFWTANSGDWIFLRSNVLLKITKLLKKEGIEIPYKQQNVYLKNPDTNNEIKKDQ
jgi:small-conductance mechanosensitive channel